MNMTSAARAPAEGFALPANDGPAPLFPFWVRTDRKRPFFPVFGRDMLAVQKAHEGMCAPGEQAVVVTQEEFFERCDRELEQSKARHHARNDARAMRLQDSRPSELDRAMRGAS